LVAVINSLGAVSERPLPAGPHAVFNPFARLETFSIKTRLLDSENVVPTSGTKGLTGGSILGPNFS